MAISAKELRSNKYRIRRLPLPEPFGKFFGNVPKHSAWKVIIYGAPGSGKSTFLLQLADVLVRFGGTLYGNLEEDTDRGTLQEKLYATNVSSNVMFIEHSTIDEMCKELDTGKYKYCIVDSVSEHCNSPKDYHLFKKRLAVYPDTTFFYVIHSTKDKVNYKGPAALSHDVDITLRCADFHVSPDKNRLQGGNTSYIYDILKRNIVQNEKNEKTQKSIKNGKAGETRGSKSSYYQKS